MLLPRRCDYNTIELIKLQIVLITCGLGQEPINSLPVISVDNIKVQKSETKDDP